MQEHNRVFDENNYNWTQDPMANYLFLKGVQNHAENVRKVRGHVLLNDVYDMLGFKRTTDGCVWGWIDHEVVFFSLGDPVVEIPMNYQIVPQLEGVIYTRLGN